MKIEIQTTDRQKIQVEVKNYDAVKVNEELNTGDGRTIVIGDAILDKSNVMRVIPIS